MTAAFLHLRRDIPLFWLAWVVAAVVATALAALAAVHSRFPGDLVAAQTVESLQPPLYDYVTYALGVMGRSPLFPAIALALAAAFALVRQPLAAGFVVLSLMARGAGGIVKDLVERPRPSPLLVDVTEQANGFSFPSGHALGSILLWGFVCYAGGKLIPNRKARLAFQVGCVLLILLTGLQRVQTGVHWPSDVMAGYLLGGLLLVVLIRLYDYIRVRWLSPTP